MPWVTRGLRNGVVTTGYPGVADPYFESWLGVADLVDAGIAVPGWQSDAVRGSCPTGAIDVVARSVVVDAGRCIGCGRCLARYPDLFGWRVGSDVSALTRTGLMRRAEVGPAGGPDLELHLDPDLEPENEDLEVQQLRERLAVRVKAFGRSIHVRHVDAGSDGSEEWEVAALLNPVYDIHRLGIFFTASPRHADILLVTGVGASGMQEPLRRTLDAMPRPIVVVAVGADACSGGMHAGSYVQAEGVGALVDVDVWVPGSPPSPFAILHGLLLALGRAEPRRGRRPGVNR
jgi:Ni,Fe-hydrogenase III small subunit/ferredoxin